MKNDFTISMAALLFSVVIAIVAPSNAAALEFIYCQSPTGYVRAISKTYASDCQTGLAAPGSREISESRAKTLFEEERRTALGKEQLRQTQAPAAPVAAAPPLVDDFYVWAHLGQPGFVFLDVGGGRTNRSKVDYLKAHIQDAVYTDYAKDGWRITDVSGTPGMLPRGEALEALEKLIGGLGIGNADHVIIVTAGESADDMAAGTRIYWTFKVLGHDRVSLLNGGMVGYMAEKFMPTKKPVNFITKGDVKPVATVFEAKPQFDMIASKADVREAYLRDLITVDNRSHSDYIGASRYPDVARTGTVPLARSLPYTSLTVDGGGVFRDLEDLLTLYAKARIPTTGPQISFCNTAHEATLGWFVSHELLGNKLAKVYDGSMVEWALDGGLPMVVGRYEK